MAVLRSIDGTFYEVPDEDLDKYKVAPAKVKELLRDQDPGPEGPPASSQGGGPGGPGMGGPGMGVAGGTVVINVFTGGGPGGGGMQGPGGDAGQGPMGPPPEGDNGGGDDDADVTAQQCGGWYNRPWYNRPWYNRPWRNCQWRNCY